jgi:hypothetical protein
MIVIAKFLIYLRNIKEQDVNRHLKLNNILDI